MSRRLLAVKKSTFKVIANRRLEVISTKLPPWDNKPQNTYENFRFIWIHQFKSTSGAVKSIDQLTNELYGELFIRNEAKTRNHLWLVLRDLAVAWLQSEGMFLGIHLNANQYAKGKLSYKLGLTYKPMVKVINALKEKKLIFHKTGHYSREHESGKVSRIKANDTLIEKFKQAGVKEDIDAVYPISKPVNPVDIRDGNKNSHYRLPKTPEFQQLKAEIIRYNDALENTYIDISLDNYDYPVKIDLTKKYVYRIFNNSSLERGGRLYGAWWANCPSKLRSRIFINKTETVELDLKALHPILLYAESGIDYFKKIGADPYLSFDFDQCMNRHLPPDEKIQFRNLMKQMFMSLVNNSDEDEAKQSLNHAIFLENKRNREYGELYTYPKLRPHKLWHLWEAFKLSHARISRFFAGNGSDEPASLRLMNIDSYLIVRVLMRMLDKNVTCLSVHDSLIAPYDRKDLAFEVFQSEFINTLRSLGMSDMTPRIEIDDFFRKPQLFGNSLILGEDKELLKRTYQYHITNRNQFINYYPFPAEQ